MLRFVLVLFLIFGFHNAFTQEYERPTHSVGKLVGEIILDGNIDEEAWQNAPLLTDFKTTVPIEGGNPTGVTQLRILTEDKMNKSVIFFQEQPEWAALKFLRIDRDLHDAGRCQV